MALKVEKIGSNGTDTDLSQLVQTLTWNGEYRQCARTVKLTLLSAAYDNRVPNVTLELAEAAMVRVSLDGAVLFWGRVFERSRATSDHLYSVTCYDLGIYLQRNEAVYSFRAAAADAMARRVCRDFSIEVGNLAVPGVAIDRDFPGESLYRIIQTGYHLSAIQTGKAYQIRFVGATLTVVEKTPGAETLIIRPKSNLMTASVTESAAQMVNQVQILDKNNNQIGSRQNAENVALFGLMQTVIRQQSGVNMDKQAEKLLADGDVVQKISVSVLGNPAFITGNCVVMQEAVTGLYGLFWIDADTHSWNRDGTYTCKLTLNFRRLMDEVEAGSYKEG